MRPNTAGQFPVSAGPQPTGEARQSSHAGVLLIGHGTRDQRGTEQFFQLGRRLGELLQPMPVEACLLEFQQPTISQAWKSLVQSGVDRVHAAPLLLFGAGHAKQDIPQELKACQTESPAVSFDQCRPISRHSELVKLVCRRISNAAKETVDESTALVMVGRGNRDPCAQADMRVLTEVVARRFRFAVARTAFYAMAKPSLTDVLDQVAGSGRYQTVVVHPHLLFAGRLFEAIAAQVDQARSRYPHVEFRLGDYLGPEPEIAAAISARIAQPEKPTANTD